MEGILTLSKKEQNRLMVLNEVEKGKMVIREAAEMLKNNPVRAGRVKRAWEYPGSSAKFHKGGQKVDVLVKDRNLLELVVNGREFL